VLRGEHDTDRLCWVARQQQRHAHQRQASGAGIVTREDGVELALREALRRIRIHLRDDGERDRSDAVRRETGTAARIDLGVHAQQR